MNKVLDCFDHAFVINLPDEIQRLAETRRELTRHDIPFETLRGVEIHSYFSDKKNGDLGCMLAHLHAVREARRRGYESILIVEDDLVLLPDFRDLWNDVIPQMPGLRYDLFYFYDWMTPKPLARPIRVHSIATCVCTHFYVVHRCFYDKFSALVEAQLSAEAPNALDRLFHAPEVNVVATTYNLAGQRPARSRITRDFRNQACFSGGS
jgi:GR25 family glycosyltransferase involved in LPS biosynthesis